MDGTEVTEESATALQLYRGVVKRVIAAKACGWIAGEDGTTYFFSFRSLLVRGKIRPHVPVEFQVLQVPTKPNECPTAIQVRPL